jgi:hypothetical protein
LTTIFAVRADATRASSAKAARHIVAVDGEKRATGDLVEHQGLEAGRCLPEDWDLFVILDVIDGRS